MSALETIPMERQPRRRLREPPDTGALVRRARDGDLSAFETLYRRFVGRVFALCRRMAGDRDRAEELTQETFIRAWEKLGTLREECDPGPWLSRMAVNLVLTDRRSRGRRGERETTGTDYAGLGDPSGPPRPGVGLDLERAVAALPPGARTAFVLHDIEGYRHEEIAGLTGRSVGTSKAQLHRARLLLRKALKR